MQKYLSLIIAVSLVFSLFPAHAQDMQEIFISRTQEPFPIIDGKWTSDHEWSISSERTYTYEEAKLVLRAAHDRENIYILLDMVTDITVDDKGDMAVVCFDTEVEGGDAPDVDDYCFSSVLGGGFDSYRGGGTSPDDNFLIKISTPRGAEMKAGIASIFDRYSGLAHAAYELKIPSSSMKKTDTYGFYFAVFDASSKTTYSWPISVSQGDKIVIRPPDQWGKLISPDKSLPEFPGIAILVVSGLTMSALTLLTRYKNKTAKF